MMKNKLLILLALTPILSYAQSSSDNYQPGYWTNKAIRRGLGENVDTPFDKAMKASMAGDTKAQVAIGTWYMDGINGAPKNPKEGIKWFEVAAKNGSPEANNNLGLAYIQGVGVTKNPTLAKDYFQKSIDGGYLDARNNLAILYMSGDLGTPNPKLALDILKPAVSANDPKALKLTQAINQKLNQIYK